MGYSSAFDRYGRITPTIVMTAAEDASRRAADIGVDAYLSIPFDLDSLVAMVGEYLPAASWQTALSVSLPAAPAPGVRRR